MRLVSELKLDFDDVLIRPKRSKTGSRSQVALVRTYETLNSHKSITCVPIIAANMSTIGTFAMASALDQLGMLTCLHKFYSEDALVKFYKNNTYVAMRTFYTLGISDQDISKLERIARQVCEIPRICIDVANGYTEFFQNRVQKIRSLFPFAIIMAGNVATPEMTQELLISGAADIVKIGIGPGSVCETRIVTGVGYPQLSAIIECADAAHGVKGLVCADGGCRNSGHIAKAFGAGADFVMLGGMLAGCDECDGDWEHFTDTYTQMKTSKKKSLTFYGMSSTEAMNKYAGGVSDYKASEGRSMSVPYKGPVSETAKQIMGGLRSTCSYVGAESLKDLSKCTTFVRCTSIHDPM